MISLFKRKKSKSNKTKVLATKTTRQGKNKNSTVSLLPGSKGEHSLQKKHDTRQRALRFYDKQIINHLSATMQDFIIKQEVMFIATADGNGECDCSARFGQPGFVRILNQDYLVYPEYRGNGVLASQGNILENPHIGLIFVDFFTTTVGLHVNGAARVIDNDQLNEALHDLPTNITEEMQQTGNKQPERWIMVEVEEAYIHCSKHIPLLKKLDKKIDWGTDDMAAKGGDFFQLEKLSIYEKMGKQESIKMIVDVFYRKIIADPLIRDDFENIDITTQIESLSTLLTLIFTQQESLLKENLDKMQLKSESRLFEHLYSSLNELEMPTTTVNEIKNRLDLNR